MSDIYAENHQNDPREPETPLKTQLEKARRLMIHVDGDRDWDVGSRLTVEQVLAIAEVCKNAHAYVLGMEGRASPPAQEAPAWRPIETAPRDGTIIIYRFDGSVAGECWWDADRDEWQDNQLDQQAHPEDWMPLPGASAAEETVTEAMLSAAYAVFIEEGFPNPHKTTMSRALAAALAAKAKG